MAATATSRGHPVEFDWSGDTWRWEDTGEAMDSERPCAECGEPPTEDGHDHCIADLPGVDHACCGHGVGPGAVVADGEWRQFCSLRTKHPGRDLPANWGMPGSGGDERDEVKADDTEEDSGTPEGRPEMSTSWWPSRIRERVTA